MAITVVQKAQNKTTSSSASFSVTVTLGSSTTAGNCLVATVCTTSTSGNNPLVSGIKIGGSTDNWASLTSFGNASSDLVFAFWADNNCVGGQTSVVVSVGSASGTCSLAAAVFEVSGLATSSVFDKSAGSPTNGSSGTWTSGNTASLSQSNEIAFGMVGEGTNSGLTITGPGATWVNSAEQSDSNNVNTMAGYNIVSISTGIQYSGTFSPNASNWGAAIVTLKAAAASGGGAAGTLTRTGLDIGRSRLRQHTRGQLSGMGISAGIAGTQPLQGQTVPVLVQAIAGTTSGAVSFAQQVTQSSTFEYGLSTVNLNTTTGNTLIMYAGWDLSTVTSTANMAALWVTDSAGNIWRHAGTSASSNNGSRSSIWICTNARSVDWISVSPTSFVSSLAYTILELANMPLYFNLDIAASNTNTSANTLTVSGGRTSTGDIAFSLFTTGGTGQVPSTPSGWMALTPVSAGAGSPNAVEIFPYWQSVASGVNLNTTWNISNAVPVSGLVVAINGAPSAPVQTNTKFPLIKVEAAFGYTPGDPSQAPPTDGGTTGVSWTDISSRAISASGTPTITSVMGREYELSTAEAGELTIGLDNHDGAFTPGNAGSPYYPNVLLGTPVRVSAFWQTFWYPIGFGYVERWPQEWPDLPQWGISQMVATDAMAVAASVTMTSALDGDILLDAPYVFIQASEQYTTFTNGLDGFFSAADAQGLLAANTSRVNQRAAMYVDGTVDIANTGQTTIMLGDADTGFGAANVTNPPSIPGSGPGIIYTDGNIPDPLDPNGVTVEFWVYISVLVSNANLQPTVFSAYGLPSNYQTTNPALTVQVLNEIGNNTIKITFADGSTLSAPFTVNARNSQQILFTMTAGNINVYVNGGLAASSALSASQVTHWTAISLGNPNYAFQSGNIVVGNFTAFDLAVYPYILANQRIQSHYVTGFAGQENVDATARLAQILTWNNLGLGRGGQIEFNGVFDGVTQGPAYDLSGQNASDAINQLAINHNAQVVAQPTGAIVFFHRWALYNQTPVITFGDTSYSVTDNNYVANYSQLYASGGEVPYLQDVSVSYDNTYVYNVTKITQQFGATTTITVTAADFNSQHDYFTRSALTETIKTMSNLDVYDLANWLVNKYAQPVFRVGAITVDAASNPSVLSSILPLQQGQPVTVIRRPMGGAIIEENYLIQKITYDIGPGVWKTTYQLSPYFPESNVLQLDNTTYNVLGNETLG